MWSVEDGHYKLVLRSAQAIEGSVFRTESYHKIVCNQMQWEEKVWTFGITLQHYHNAVVGVH